VVAGIGDSLIGTVKSITEIPSSVAELTTAIGNKIAEDPVGVAKTCANLVLNPLARVELTMNVAGAVAEGVTTTVADTIDAIVNAESLEERTRLISKLATDVATCFIPLGAIAKTGRAGQAANAVRGYVTTGARATQQSISALMKNVRPNVMAGRPLFRPQRLVNEAVEGAVKSADAVAESVIKRGTARNADDLAASAGKGTDDVIVRTSKEGATFGEKTAHDEMIRRNMEPVGKTNGVYVDGATGIDGVYKNTSPPLPPDYIITEAKYNKAALDKTVLADGTKQMDNDWILNRLEAKVGADEAEYIEDAIRLGNIERWKIQVSPDGTTYISKIDAKGNVIRGNAGKVD
jgi:hypothetical protein